MSGAYYNEIDPFAAEWLRRLILFGHIAPGDVDERDIRDVSPDDLRGFRQHHFFAGLGGWSYSLRLAGWADDRAVATLSCPCQPFSAAGPRSGFADERHLWPAAHHLVRECRFPVVLGEQVATKDGLAWLDLVCADMEGDGYTGGAVVTAAAGFGAPIRRERLYLAWLADAAGERREGAADGSEPHGGERFGLGGEAGGMACAAGERRNRRRAGETGDKPCPLERSHGLCVAGAPGPVNGFWRDADWIGCTDGKWRPVGPGAFPLANGVSARMGRLRGYGNAINTAQAAAFIESVMEYLA